MAPRTSPAAPPAPAAAAVYLHLDELRPNPRNPRLHGDEVAALARTILRTAWGAPIVAQARSKRIIGGHGRLEAAKLILAGLVVDGEQRGGPDHRFDPAAPEPGMVPVRLVNVSDAEADAMTLADNARALQGQDDGAAIVAMAAQFGRESAAMADLGLDADSLDALVAAAGDAILAGDTADGDGSTGEDRDAAMAGVVQDDAPVEKAEELRAKWDTALGQLWEIPSAKTPGAVHRILCGDSRVATDVARLLGGETARWMWTDPPYGVSYVGGTADAMSIMNDDAAGLPSLLKDAFAAADGVLENGAPVYVAHPAGPLSVEFVRAFSEVGWKLHETLVWVKNAMVLGHSDYHYKHEPILYGWKGKNRRWFGGRDKVSTLEFDKPPRNDLHPTMKPIALVAACLLNSSAPGDLGYEPFSGSGTTLMAAEQVGRVCRAMELDPKYVAVALERLSGLGLTPRRVS